MGGLFGWIDWQDGINILFFKEYKLHRKGLGMKSVLIALFLGSLVACSSPSKEFDTICEIFEKHPVIVGEPSIDSSMRVGLIAKEISETSLSIKKRFLMIMEGAPSNTYELLQGLASDQGIESWQCQALADYYQ